MIDTHCHLNLADGFPNPADAIEDALRAGVEKIVVVGIDDETSAIAVDLADQHEACYAVVGWHPTSVANFTDTGRIESLCANDKAVAIGEIGLDYHWDFSTPEQQFVALNAQWSLACRLEMPVVFHCREAYDDLLDWLEARDAFPPSLVLHCFAGSLEHAKRALALPAEAFFGVDGPITYKKADGLREVMRGLPLDRIVLETDAPYLTPHPHRGKKNSPAMIPLICEGLASALGKPASEIARTTSENALRLFPRLR